MLKRHAPSRQKRRGRLPLPPRSSPGAATSPTSKRSKTAPLLGDKDTTCDITTSSTITSTANGNCEAGGLRSSRRSARLSVVVGRAERVLGRLSGLGPAPGRKSPTSTVKAAIDGEETELSDLIHEQPREYVDDKTQHQASVSKSRVSPDAHQGEAETVAARSRGRRSSGRPEAVGPTSRHPSSSRHPASRPKKHRGPSRAGVVDEEAEMDWREPVLSPQKSPAASPGGETAPNGRGGVGLSRGRRGRVRGAGSNKTGAGSDAEGAARGVAVESSRKLAAKDRGVVGGKARCEDGGVPLMKPPLPAAAAAAAVPNTTTAIAKTKATAKAPATAKAKAKATATAKATAKSTPKAKAKAKAKASAAAASAAATSAAAAAIGSNGSIPNGVSETEGMLALPAPPAKKEELPRCPYPGYENVSWTCRACGGAAHHLTSRFAMEPLQRVHGFKVHRVPNDGDCFFSSIKAALEAGSGMCQNSGGAASAAAAAAAVVAAGLTVAKMREWVAEETGEEQLAFYTLQAKANPEDRWLDFVRPLDERVRSDDEEEEEEEREERGRRGRRKDEEKSEEREGEDDSSEQEGDSCEEESESASQWSETTTVASSEAGTQRSRRQGRKEDDPGAGGSTTTTAAAVRSVRRNRRSGASAAGESEADNARPPSDEKPTDQLEASSSTNTEAVQNGLALPRRRGRPRSKGSVAVPKVAVAVAAATVDAAGVEATTTTATAKTTLARKSNACSMRSSRGAAANKSLISSRLRTRKGASRVEEGSEEKVGGEEEEDAKGQDAAGGRQKGGEKGEAKEEEEEEEEEEGEEEEELPEVKTLDELRQFVRLEGSVVGHGRCMWADTFAHHVVSRRLGLTILFVDMEREKSAWPYRVLARADEDGKSEQEERFVVLKREPNHFVLVKTAPPPADKEGGKAGDCGGEGDVNGVGAPPPLSGWGQACFRRSELPEAVKRLWQIEPEVAGPVLPPPPPPPPRPTGTGQKSPPTTATVTAAAEIGGS